MAGSLCNAGATALDEKSARPVSTGLDENSHLRLRDAVPVVSSPKSVLRAWLYSSRSATKDRGLLPTKNLTPQASDCFASFVGRPSASDVSLTHPDWGIDTGAAPASQIRDVTLRFVDGSSPNHPLSPASAPVRSSGANADCLDYSQLLPRPVLDSFRQVIRLDVGCALQIRDSPRPQGASIYISTRDQ